MSEEDERVSRGRAVLAAAGFPTATLTVAGHDGSVAVIGGVPPDQLAAVARLAGEVRTLGFRYVTLDISDSPA
jgi:hypothetical protein